jgi:predicted nucleotidyltransferase
MNREEKIMKRLQEHYDEALEYFPENRIVGIFLQGSQNYGLDYEGSDIDTKLIVVPSLEDIVLNKKPVSTTHVRANDEHIDFKDVRLYMDTFKKQNLNFLEILFTPFKIINPMYADEWNRLVERREEIARMNEVRAVKSMKGVALEKFHAMEHRYPSKIDIIDRYGYDGKQVSHLIRVDDYLERYIKGERYESCLRPTDSKIDEIMKFKLLKYFSLAEAQVRALEVKAHVEKIADEFCEGKEEYEKPEMRELLESVQTNIMKAAIRKELEE